MARGLACSQESQGGGQQEAQATESFQHLLIALKKSAPVITDMLAHHPFLNPRPSPTIPSRESSPRYPGLLLICNQAMSGRV